MPRIEDNARDEHFWHAMAQRYDVAPGPINLENGYFGRMTRGVAQDYQRQVDFINRSNSVHVRFLWREIWPMVRSRPTPLSSTACWPPPRPPSVSARVA